MKFLTEKKSHPDDLTLCVAFSCLNTERQNVILASSHRRPDWEWKWKQRKRMERGSCQQSSYLQ